MEDGDTEKYHPSSVIQDFVFSSRKSSCIRCITLQVYNKTIYNNSVLFGHLPGFILNVPDQGNIVPDPLETPCF